MFDVHSHRQSQRYTKEKEIGPCPPSRHWPGCSRTSLTRFAPCCPRLRWNGLFGLRYCSLQFEPRQSLGHLPGAKELLGERAGRLEREDELIWQMPLATKLAGRVTLQYLPASGVAVRAMGGKMRGRRVSPPPANRHGPTVSRDPCCRGGKGKGGQTGVLRSFGRIS